MNPRVLLGAGLVFLFTLAHAQDPAASYPSKPIRIFGQGTGSKSLTGS